MAKLIEKVAATEITQFPPASVLMQRAQNAMPVNPNPMSMGTAAVPMAPGAEEAQQGTAEGQGKGEAGGSGEAKKKSGSNKIQIEVVAGGGAKSKATSKATSKAAKKPKAKAKKK